MNLHLPFLLLFIMNTSLLFAAQVKDLPVPKYYKRVNYVEGSFSAYMQHLPLKNTNTVLTYKGQNVNSFYNILAVIAMPILFNSDLEQCADYSMRFWAEYHKDKKKLGQLYLYEYSGKKRYFKKSGKKYLAFLRYAMAFSNSYSIKAGATKVKKEDLRPGDMFVQNQTGGIGHVSVIVDVCENLKGEKLYLVGYSFMPAQEFHIERAEKFQSNMGWFTFDGYCDYLDSHFSFGTPVLRRF